MHQNTKASNNGRFYLNIKTPIAYSHRGFPGAFNRNRTDDLILTMDLPKLTWRLLLGQNSLFSGLLERKVNPTVTAINPTITMKGDKNGTTYKTW